MMVNDLLLLCYVVTFDNMPAFNEYLGSYWAFAMSIQSSSTILLDVFNY